jgi:hypothetical protein
MFLTLNNLVRFLCFIIGVALSSLFFTKCVLDKQSTQDKGGVLTSDVKVKTDTVFIMSKPLVVHDTIYKPSLVKVVYKDRPIPTHQPDGTLTLNHRVYSDSLTLKKDLKVGYTAEVTGTLDQIDLGIRDTRPQLVIRDSVFTTNTITKTKHPTGIYLGGFTSKNLTNYGPEVQLVRPKFSLGVGYDLQQSSPQLRFGINLRRDKP